MSEKYRIAMLSMCLSMMVAYMCCISLYSIGILEDWQLLLLNNIVPCNGNLTGPNKMEAIDYFRKHPQIRKYGILDLRDVFPCFSMADVLKIQAYRLNPGDLMFHPLLLVSDVLKYSSVCKEVVIRTNEYVHKSRRITKKNRANIFIILNALSLAYMNHTCDLDQKQNSTLIIECIEQFNMEAGRHCSNMSRTIAHFLTLK